MQENFSFSKTFSKKPSFGSKIISSTTKIINKNRKIIPKPLTIIRTIKRHTNIKREKFTINPAIYNTPNPEIVTKNRNIVQSNVNNLSSFINSAISNKIISIQFTHVNTDNSITPIVFNNAKACEDYMINTLDKQANMVIIDLNKIRDVISLGLIKNSYEVIKRSFNDNYNTIENNLKLFISNPSNKVNPPPPQIPNPTPPQIPNPPPPQIPTYKTPVISTPVIPDPNMITLSNYYNFGRTNEGFSNYISPNNLNNMPIIEGLTDTNVSGITEIMKKEKELVRQLNEFNEKYELYIECNDLTNKNRGNLVCTGNAAVTKGNLITQMNNINGLIYNINDNIGVANYNSNYNYTDYKNNYYNIVNDHKTVKNLRNELDMKVQRLYDPEKSMISDYGYNLDSTIYSGILISALATSMLYYIFTEL
jgi:hypothetical protein